MEQNSLYSDKTRFTRMCIAQAVIELMKNDSIEKITVSAVVKRAGVSRMTFYNYYHTLVDALTDYLEELVAEYLVESEKDKDAGNYLEYSHILFSLNFFDRYADYFLTMTANHLQYILMDGINDFMQKYSDNYTGHSAYELYCYSGGLLNTFLKWEEGGKKESPEVIAEVLFRLYNRS